MSADLKVLADNKANLLLAEVAAWLHDMGKCSDKFVISSSCDKPSGFEYKSKEDYLSNFNENNNEIKSIFENTFVDFSKVNFINEKVTLNDLIVKGLPRTNKEKEKDKFPWLVRTLGRCHGAAHIEKEDSKEFKQYKNYTMISNPFGFEKGMEGLSSKLITIPYNKINDRSFFVKSVVESFNYALGDTRRPTNEVTLTDWSGIVAALYKSALASALLLKIKTDPTELKWRFLSIRFNSEQIWGNAQNIPILATRKKMLTEGLDRVKLLLEETYLLGNEIYRDEDNSIFVVPDISYLLDKTSEKNEPLKQLIANEFGFEGEVVITPEIGNEWWAQKPDRENEMQNDEIPPIAKILSNQRLYSPADPKDVAKFWEGTSNRGICTISWLRPQGPTSKGFNRKASDCWVERVTWRANEWYHSLDSTIWIDEVADSNDRICLLTGRFDLLEWLKPDGYISTIKIRSEPNGKVITKTPSFARMNRIWRTTKKFWEDVENELGVKIGQIDNRLKIIGKFQPENNSSLKMGHSYKAMLDRIGFSIFYGKEDEFLVIENHKELANKFGFDSEKYVDKNPTRQLKEYLSTKKVKIYDSEGKNRSNPIGTLEILEMKEEDTPYVPLIPILTEPSIFMAIIPAEKALDVSRLIKIKYETEMGKVRNRLPLSLGMVFAKSHTPLAALMDAGRKMLRKSNKEKSAKEDKWILEENPIKNYNSFTLKFNNGIKWKIPSIMGDEKTLDIWYPYFYVDGELRNRSDSFIHSFKNPENSDRWLVHVSELKEGDIVGILPSKFDFEFLDSASRRFEICYDEKGNRRGSLKALRPYLLEELDNFTDLWNICSKNLSNTQIRNIITLIEKKREEWDIGEDTIVFENFVHDVLYNANWNNGKRPDDAKMTELEDAAKSGKLRDILELNLNILKNRAEEASGGI
ncbi:CRISPR-associated protein Csx11 [Methanosarcina mazei]|nr:CRISPR-associated protein Csx11 [Methanosarcina mazei]